jgi:hypothetical protein
LREILLGLDWAAIIQKTGEVPEWLKGLVLKTRQRVLVCFDWSHSTPNCPAFLAIYTILYLPLLFGSVPIGCHSPSIMRGLLTCRDDWSPGDSNRHHTLRSLVSVWVIQILE